MSREIKFEYGFEKYDKSIIKKVYNLSEIPNISKKCDLWNELPVQYVRQYTGLKDKNGKEIYEGDIIQFDFGKDSKEGVINTEVIFVDGCFMYKGYKAKQVSKGDKWEQKHDYVNSNWWGSDPYPLCGGFYGEGDLKEYKNKESKIEVIGNIYQNPELLK